jgi:hypothetical protein
MKSRIFGVLTCVTFTLTSAAYLSFGNSNIETENPTSVPLHRSTFGSDQAETGIFRWNQKKTTATSLSAVGWKGCKWCDKLKKEVLPVLVKQGYDVRYVDIKDWKGPKVKAGPTLFYIDGKKKIVKIEKGYKTVEHIKKTLQKPSLK